ncbi:MAG: integration host factor subunit beta [Desulfamplus sp.]|nr:integration host factor subunit beta [Desulfamplus sp.]
MNKIDLIRELKTRSNLAHYEAVVIVNTFFKSIADALASGDRVEIRGFCSFYVKEYKAYMGRNPKTKVQVQIPAKRLPFFKCGKELKERVNDKKKNKHHKGDTYLWH